MKTALIVWVVVVLLVQSTGNAQSDSIHPKDAGPGSGTFNLHDNERNLIVQALSASNNNTAEAAKKLGISEHALLRKMNGYKIDLGASNRKAKEASSNPKVLGSTREVDRSRLPLSTALIDVRMGPMDNSAIIFDCVSYQLDRSAMGDQFPINRRCSCRVSGYHERKTVFTLSPITEGLKSEETFIDCRTRTAPIPVTAAMIDAVFTPFKVLKYKVIENGVESSWITGK